MRFATVGSVLLSLRIVAAILSAQPEREVLVRVISAGSLAPVGNAQVTILAGGANARPACSTGSDGQCLVRVPSGPVAVVNVSTPGLGAQPARSITRVIRFATDSSVLVVKLPENPSLSGVIQDLDGKPGPASVTLFREQIWNGFPQLRLTTGANADEQGRFSFPSLPPGRYWLRASPTPHPTRELLNQSAEAQAAAVRSTQDSNVLPTYFGDTQDPAAAIAMDLPQGSRREGIIVRLREGKGKCARFLSGARLPAGFLLTGELGGLHLAAGSFVEPETRICGLPAGALRVFAFTLNPSHPEFAQQDLFLTKDDQEVVLRYRAPSSSEAELRLSAEAAQQLKEGETILRLSLIPIGRPPFPWEVDQRVEWKTPGPLQTPPLAEGSFEPAVTMGSSHLFLRRLSYGPDDLLRSPLTPSSSARRLLAEVDAGAGSLRARPNVQGEGVLWPARCVLVRAEEKALLPGLKLREQPLIPDQEVLFQNLAPGKYLLIAIPEGLAGLDYGQVRLSLRDAIEVEIQAGAIASAEVPWRAQPER